MTDVSINVDKPAGKQPRLFLWTADRSGCGYYRMALHGLMLHNAGWKVAADENMRDEVLEWDVVTAQRTCLPGPSFLLKVMVTAGMPVVYEIDDLLTEVGAYNTPQAVQFYGQAQTKKLLRQNMRNASALVVSTQPLYEHYGKFNENVHLIPNTIDERILALETMPRTDDRVTIGWAGGSSHSWDFDEFRESLHKVMAQHPVRWQANGHSFDLDVPQERYTHVGWQEDMLDHYRGLNFDIGVAPLRRTRFNDAKSPIKVMEYGARGIPYVATKYGPYERYVEHGYDGFLARNEREWTKYLNELIEDEDMRREMGMNAKRKALQHSTQRHVSRYEDLYLGLMNRRTHSGPEVAERVRRGLTALPPELR